MQGLPGKSPFLPGRISPSEFPLQGTYYPICEYLVIYLCVLVGLYHFFGGGRVYNYEVFKNMCLSVAEDIV